MPAVTYSLEIGSYIALDCISGNVKFKNFPGEGAPGPPYSTLLTLLGANTPRSFLPKPKILNRTLHIKLDQRDCEDAKSHTLPYNRKLSRVKTFANFAVLPASANFSARRLGERVGLKRERFIREMLCFIEFAKVFTRESFRLYGIHLAKTDIAIASRIFAEVIEARRYPVHWRRHHHNSDQLSPCWNDLRG